MSNADIGTYENGIYRKGDVRISDLSSRKMLPIGDDLFATTVQNSVFIDKTMLIADVLDSGSKATLFCRPRRFGKSLNLNMMQRFFEIPSISDPAAMDTTPLFEGLSIWDADDGRYREHHGAYPVIYFSFKALKSSNAEEFLNGVAVAVADEYRRHAYLAESALLSEYDRAAFDRLASGEAEAVEVKASLQLLSRLLFKHHGRRVVVLIDEYDAPVMAAYTNGFYSEVIDFVKAWLTAALKSSEALAFACLTGVQRISKESIFSDLNNLTVNTSLNVRSDERYGFTDAEVAALAEYLGDAASVDEVRRWYDGYRFGNADIYNPWSVLNYFHSDCVADVYWGNTSGNAVLGDMVRDADARTFEDLCRLMQPRGTIEAPLDLGIVFPDIGIRPGTLWSMLYLAGYLTTDDTTFPNNAHLPRPLRIPNQEIAQLYRGEIVERFAAVAGNVGRLYDLHRAFAEGDGPRVEEALSDILLNSASYFDLANENGYHMLMMGLLFGTAGYGDPCSNREAGLGRYDIQLMPVRPEAPVVTLELKYAAPTEAVDAPGECLAKLAAEALAQIASRRYDDGAPAALRYGIAFSGKHVAVAVEKMTR